VRSRAESATYPTSPSDGFFRLLCPFDDDYRHLFRALIFTINACGFRARSARELDDCGQTRISKLYSIIELIRWYHEFMAMLPSIADELDLDAATASYVDFEKMLLAWLLDIKAVKN